MNNTIPRRFQWLLSFSRFALAAWASLTLISPMLGATDPSISEAAWGVSQGVTPAQIADAAWMSQDTDGDGQTNVAELAAGTNPFKAQSVIAISGIQVSGEVVRITFPTVAGKGYVIQESANLADPQAWETVRATRAIGDGGPKTVEVPKGLKGFYRVLVEDVDSNGDGVADYADAAFRSHFGGATSFAGSGGSAPAANGPSAPSIVTVAATVPQASEDGPVSGMFTMTRSGGGTNALMVGYSISGTATNPSDHSLVGGWVDFAVNTNTATVSVTPVADDVVEAGESVVLIITWVLSMDSSGSLSIAPGNPKKATVIINDSTAPTGTGLLGQYYDTASTTYSNAANFDPNQLKFSRVDPTVDFTWLQGTPNGAVINTANSPDNYSVVWEGYLHPTTAGSYNFQLDADEMARVLLDRNDGNGLVPILEHRWNGAAGTVGNFAQTITPVILAVPASPAQRYRIRVEYMETTGDARCRLQWKRDAGAFADIPSTQVFAQTQTMTYSYTKQTTGTGTAVITPGGGHSLLVGNQVNLNFSSGNLYASGNYSGPFTITAVTATTFSVAIAGAAVPNTGTGSGFLGNSASTTAGWLAKYYPNATFTSPATLVRVDTAVTNGNAGIWGSGTPDLMIVPDTFSVRWTGQVQPQFSEEYIFVVNCDDAAKLWINGQPLTLRVAAAANSTGTYNYTNATGEVVITHANIPSGSFVVGETVRVDPTNGTLTSLAYADYVVTAVGTGTFTINVGTAFTTGSGNCNIEWLNKPVDWSSASNVAVDRYARVPLVGGVRYDIKLDYFENTSSAKCQLSWYSASLPKQIIPQARLYPASAPQQPASQTSSSTATALVGGPFSHLITGSNGATVTISGKPSWMTFSGGVLSGTPPAGSAGDYEITITTTTATGTGTSVLKVHVEDTGATIGREYWSGVEGTAVSSIPTSTVPTGTGSLTSLEAPTDFGDDYGVRIRGYITAPTTGNYYFWIAASDSAELWISNDDEPVNAMKRAAVATGSATPQTWNAEPNQKSPWLALEAGRKYYLEILHKAATGDGDNLAVGWAKPGESGTAPSQIVPGYVLSPYVPPAPGSTPGTLYIATMLSQNGANTNGVGTSTLRVSEDETTAYMTYSYSGLTGPITSQHIHTDPYLDKPSTIVFDIDTPETPGDGLQPDGRYKWTITPKGMLSVADIREIIKEGKAYINLHTASYPAGEIRGNYTLANGSRTFTPPPVPPSWTDDHTTDAGAVRFLTQATFGPNLADIAALKAMTSYEAWIDDQFTKPASEQLPEVLARELSDANGGSQFAETLTFNAWWRNSITGADQLRQRVAFALSEIHVVSAQGPLDNRAEALSYFYDKLAVNAFGNFRDILENTTLTPTMGRYLDMLRNDKPDQTVGRIPNENYAREIKQLFSIGLYRMWPDGTLILNSKDSPIDTYNQREIVGFAHVFTGWDYGYDGAFRTTIGAGTNWIRQMREVPARHFTGPKRILNNEVLPGLAMVGGQVLDPYATHNTTHYNNPAYQALPAQELDAAHDQLFNHPNVGPFICRQLIQRLVTSHPSRDYLHRVVQKFNDNGSGVRGDMQAVIKAILLDYEARSPVAGDKPAYGKQREAVLRVAAPARAFRQDPAAGTYSQSGTHVITVTSPNKLAGGNTVFLEFPRSGSFAAGDTTPTSESYTVLTTPAPTSSTFAVNAKGWTGVSTSNASTNGGVTGTYTQTAGSTTMTISISGHWLGQGQKAYLDFGNVTTGTAVADGAYAAVTSTSTGSGDTGGTTFTITAPDTTARTGFVRMVRFQGSYTVSTSGLAAPNDKRITLDTTFGGIADHHLSVGNAVYLNFTAGNPMPTDAEFVVESVPDANTFTVLTSAAATGNANDADNGMWMFPLVSQPTTRSGTVNALPSTFNMGDTTSDLDQTPLSSPTVFNFFLPDFKFPGALASQGLTTPEFQDTAETTVVRQSNFLFNGIFNPGNTNGISSFKAGTNALVLNLSPWMGNATDLGLGAGPQPTQAWTSNANLGTLIDHLNTLLLAGQMPSGVKSVVQNFLYRTITSVSAAPSNPTVITSAGHGLLTGDSITISGVTGSFTTINGTFTVTKIDNDTFTVPVNHSSGTPTLTGAHFSPIAYSDGSPTDTHKRDRLRAILHLILTSPDYTIQK